MGLYLNACVFSGILFAWSHQPILILYFLSFIGVYSLLHFMTPSGKFNSVRRKIMFSSWESPKEGIIYCKQEMDCTQVLAYLETFKKEERPSMTHIAIKTMAMILDAGRDTLNGKLIFDKYVPYETVAVTCLVEIGEGNDLAAITIDNCDKMTTVEIRNFLRQKAINVKKNNGDEDHKKRTGPLKLIPPFIIRLILRVGSWVAFNWGLDIKALGVKKNTFGGGVVTSLGMLNIKDAFVPITPALNAPIYLAVGEVTQKAVVKDNQIVIAPMINFNFTIDHRFIDGGKSRSINKAIQAIFENPEKY